MFGLSGCGMIGRVLRTGLSSLRDRARSGLAALRFNPSRSLGYAMMALPFVAILAFDFIFLHPAQAVIAIVVPLAFGAWMLLAVKLACR